MGTRWKRLFALIVGSCVSCLILAACGGGGAAGSASAAKTPHEVATASAEESPESAESAADAVESPKAASCDDGTCSPCGSGICPKGWYCDESASGGPACGWLPGCTQKNSCGCLTSKLDASCKCSEQNGSLHLNCR